MSTTETHSILRGRLLACAFGFTLFVVYGSLVPLNYQPLKWEQTIAQFGAILSRPILRSNWDDIVANVLLFIPLGFLWLGFASHRGSRRLALCLAIPVVVACAILSAAIEFLQLWFPPRDASLDDILAETIGGAVGCGLWLLMGAWIMARVETSPTAAATGKKVQRLLLAYCIALACLSIMPLQQTSGDYRLFGQYRKEKIISVPFAYYHGSAWRLGCSIMRDVICFIPVGAYSAVCLLPPGRTVHPIWRSVLQGFAFVAALFLMQMSIYSRKFSVIALGAGLAGVVLGYLAMRRRLTGNHGTGADPPKDSLAPTWMILVCIVAAVAVLELLAIW